MLMIDADRFQGGIFSQFVHDRARETFRIVRVAGIFGMAGVLHNLLPDTISHEEGFLTNLSARPALDSRPIQCFDMRLKIRRGTEQKINL